MRRQLTGNIQEIIKSKEYKLIVNMGFDPATGKYPRKTRMFSGTKTEAEYYLRQWIYELEQAVTRIVPLATRTAGEIPPPYIVYPFCIDL